MDQRIIVNGQTNERVVFGEYGTDAEGEYLWIDEVSLPAGSQGPPEHRHLRGEERFEVVEGKLGIRVDGQEFVLGPGETATVPAGARHTWFNAGDTTVVGRGELREPGRFEELLTTVFTLMNTGRVNRRGQPGLIQGSVTLAEYREEYDPAYLPRPVKWVALNLLAPLGRTLGYEAVHEYVPPADDRSAADGSAELVVEV